MDSREDVGAKRRSLPLPTPAQLEAFVAVGRQEHVSKAAEELGMSQPAVTHQLHALERILGFELFERVGRGVRLSVEGRALLATASEAVEALHTVAETAAALRGLHKGELAVAAGNAIGVYRLPNWIAGFVQIHPRVQIRATLVDTAGAMEMLRASQVDCALVGEPCDRQGLEALCVGADELVVVAAPDHPLARLNKVGAAELAQHRYLARQAEAGMEGFARDLLGAAYRDRPVMELARVDAVRGGVIAGLGYAILPRIAVEDDLQAGRAVILPTRKARGSRTLWAVRRRTSHGPGLKAFWEYLRAETSSPAGVPNRAT